jgi:uncharacterized protein (DUF58 family)
VSETVRISAYPTRRAVFAMAAGLPVSLAVALIFPALWVIGAGWLAGVIGLMALDWILSVRGRSWLVAVDAPSRMDVGSQASVRLDYPEVRPHNLEASLSANEACIIRPGVLEASLANSFTLEGRRRGDAALTRLWQRWTGPLGLMWTQRVDPLDQDIAIVTDTTRLTEEALNLLNRHADFGQKLQRLKGEGTEFDALSDFQQGMDPRSIDWKHSARHGTLLAREYETEKNNHIIFAFDSGYLMCEETADDDGLVLTKLDRSIGAAMLMGFVSLRLGDRVGLFGFDERPYLYAPPVTGGSAFAQLQNQSAQIGYSPAETNFTLGLTTLSQRLSRRTLVVVFSDFVDTTQAELMLENVARLLKRHVVLFVSFRNSGLQTLTDQPPDTPEAIAEAVVADQLRRDRELVIARLERMGVWVINTVPGELSGRLLNTYLSLKARNVI